MTQDLVAELRRRGLTDVDDSTLTRALYSSDASIYRVVPRVVVRPRHRDELDAILDVARETGTSITMRGAGTSIAGNAVGAGIVVDTVRHLNRIVAVDPEARTATVEPGVVHATLQRAAVGARSAVRAGPVHAHPLHDRRDDRQQRVRQPGAGLRPYRRQRGRAGRGVPGGRRGRTRLRRQPVGPHLGHVRTHFGRFSRQVSGYALEHLLPERRSLDRFLVGSEGTLAMVREATVALVPDEPRHLVVLGFGSITEAADAVPGLLGLSVDGARLVACEGLDSRIVDLVAQRCGGVPELPRGSGWLFVELVGSEAESLVAAVSATAGDGRATGDRPGRGGGAVADPRGRSRTGRTEPGQPGVLRLGGCGRPPDHLGAWLRDFDGLLSEHGLSGVPYGHFGDGCVHVRIDFAFEPGGRLRPRSFRDFLTASALSSDRLRRLALR